MSDVVKPRFDDGLGAEEKGRSLTLTLPCAPGRTQLPKPGMRRTQGERLGGEGQEFTLNTRSYDAH